MSLGKIIAWLKMNGRDNIVVPEDKGFSKELTHRVCAEYQKLRADNQYKAAVPQLRCSSDNIFLFDNITFFLAHILFDYAVDLKKEETLQFMRHLNDCGGCFEEYCTVFHDYCSAVNR